MDIQLLPDLPLEMVLKYSSTNTLFALADIRDERLLALVQLELQRRYEGQNEWDVSIGNGPGWTVRDRALNGYDTIPYIWLSRLADDEDYQDNDLLDVHDFFDVGMYQPEFNVVDRPEYHPLFNAFDFRQ